MSYGLWKVEFWLVTDGSPQVINYCYLDYRDWRVGGGPPGCPNNNYDLQMELRTDPVYVSNIWSRWGNWLDEEFVATDWVPITSQYILNRTIQWYRQVAQELPVPIIYECNGGQNRGNFRTSNADGGYWLNWPIDAHDFNSNYQHIDPGSLYMNLTIVSGMTANILAGKTMSIEYGATLTVQENATLHLQSNSTLLIKRGGGFCKYGSVQMEQGAQIRWERGGYYYACPAYNPVFTGGGKFIVEDSAIVEFPANCTVTFDSSAQLVMKPYSQLRFAQNSKFVFKNGARICADNATFTSVSPDSTFDGIYLYALSRDTIKNCIIVNAYNGLNVINKFAGGPIAYSTVISNCTFIDSATTQLKQAIYVSNSDNVLIRNNSISASSLGNGFTNGISLNYCPPGNLNILDNSIENSVTGIKVVGSSSYIARNSITGSSGASCGMYLDNASGTIKYNVVDRFMNSLYALYSSPYLLKNTLKNASDRNILLLSNSTPVMRPINSGTALRWLAGDNTISGSPSLSAILFDFNSYSVMDSGFNRINLSNGADYVNGSVPSSQMGAIKAYWNYWGALIPEPARFDVSGGTVLYAPWYDGSNPPPTDYYELVDIGFGLYDTVYVEDLTDNPGASELFTQAYQNEVLRQFVHAINLYQTVVSGYSSSPLAAVSLSRILNCAEKKKSTNAEYIVLENYYNTINNPAYNTEMRELAEDLTIKCKVRQGRLDDAVNDYNTMYLENQNTPKGIHALLNKEAVIALRDGSGQNAPFIGNSMSNFSEMLNPNSPGQYKLYQNYPNPFNPATVIKYEIPKGGNVSIKIYDLLGRIIYSHNEYKNAGRYELNFDATNFASGLYYYGIEIDGFVAAKKMLLVK